MCDPHEIRILVALVPVVYGEGQHHDAAVVSSFRFRRTCVPGTRNVSSAAPERHHRLDSLAVR